MQITQDISIIFRLINSFLLFQSALLYPPLSDYRFEYSFIRNTHHDKAVIYNFKESEHCYVELLDLKNKADQLFLEHKIALDLDLSAKKWYKIDYDFSGDDTLDDFEEHADVGIHEMIKDFGFAENDNFLQPEYAEYGLVLGIIKDIHLSLSMAGD